MVQTHSVGALFMYYF